MELLNILAVKDGDVVARAITNTNGAVLCPVGFVLSANVIERLKNAGVESVLVEGGASSGPTAQERMDNLTRRFQGVTDPTRLLVKSLLERRLSALNLE